MYVHEAFPCLGFWKLKFREQELLIERYLGNSGSLQIFLKSEILSKVSKR